MSFRPYKPREPGTTKQVVSALIDAAGGVKRASVQLHRSATQTLAYTDPATPDEISFDMVRRLVMASGAIAPAEDLAALAGGAFLPCPQPDESFEALAAHSAEDWGGFTATLLRACADGTLDQLDRRNLRERLDHLIRTLACARAQLSSQPEG
jgi:hypothetical protein